MKEIKETKKEIKASKFMYATSGTAIEKISNSRIEKFIKARIIRRKAAFKYGTADKKSYAIAKLNHCVGNAIGNITSEELINIIKARKIVNESD